MLTTEVFARQSGISRDCKMESTLRPSSSVVRKTLPGVAEGPDATRFVIGSVCGRQSVAPGSDVSAFKTCANVGKEAAAKRVHPRIAHAKRCIGPHKRLLVVFEVWRRIGRLGWERHGARGLLLATLEGPNARIVGTHARQRCYLFGDAARIMAWWREVELRRSKMALGMRYLN